MGEVLVASVAAGSFSLLEVKYTWVYCNSQPWEKIWSMYGVFMQYIEYG